MVAFADVEGAAIHGDGFDDGRDQKIRVGVAVAVRVGRQVIRIEKIADLIELRDGFAMIARYTRREILRSLDPA